jgi:uncharacterized glyoxalase superfamily protein PhnB
MKLNAIGLFTADVEESLRFYKLLGVPFGDYDPAEGHYSAELDGFRIMLDTEEIARAFIDDFTPPTGNDQMTLAVECDTPSDVDALYERVVAAGFACVREPFDAFWGQRYATVRDPDGNPVDLYAQL